MLTAPEPNPVAPPHRSVIRPTTENHRSSIAGRSFGAVYIQGGVPEISGSAENHAPAGGRCKVVIGRRSIIEQIAAEGHRARLIGASSAAGAQNRAPNHAAAGTKFQPAIFDKEGVVICVAAVVQSSVDHQAPVLLDANIRVHVRSAFGDSPIHRKSVLGSIISILSRFCGKLPHGKELFQLVVGPLVDGRLKTWIFLKAKSCFFHAVLTSRRSSSRYDFLSDSALVPEEGIEPPTKGL